VSDEEAERGSRRRTARRDEVDEAIERLRALVPTGRSELDPREDERVPR
jgi:hypothetical protein